MACEKLFVFPIFSETIYAQVMPFMSKYYLVILDIDKRLQCPTAAC